ncbi:hypothetical protein [Falsibacillus pallidus]|uniref:hypothetical protein n=1 Tax=Falsibacillus pallidus TaxID=493781 RepID=UPI003D980961
MNYFKKMLVILSIAGIFFLTGMVQKTFAEENQPIIASVEWVMAKINPLSSKVDQLEQRVNTLENQVNQLKSQLNKQ